MSQKEVRGVSSPRLTDVEGVGRIAEVVRQACQAVSGFPGLDDAWCIDDGRVAVIITSRERAGTSYATPHDVLLGQVVAIDTTHKAHRDAERNAMVLVNNPDLNTTWEALDQGVDDVSPGAVCFGHTIISVAGPANYDGTMICEALALAIGIFLWPEEEEYVRRCVRDSDNEFYDALRARVYAIIAQQQ